MCLIQSLIESVYSVGKVRSLMLWKKIVAFIYMLVIVYASRGFSKMGISKHFDKKLRRERQTDTYLKCFESGNENQKRCKNYKRLQF